MSTPKTLTLAELAEQQTNITKQIAAAELPLAAEAVAIMSAPAIGDTVEALNDLIARFPADRFLAVQLGHVVTVLGNVATTAANEEHRLRLEVFGPEVERPADESITQTEEN